jgi:signal transduction histidine kinase
VKLHTRLGFWYAAILLVGLLFIAGRTYYEMVFEHPSMTRALLEEGHTPQEEFWEVMAYGGLPAVVLALVGGWFLMRRALQPVTTLTHAVENVRSDTLKQRIPRTGNRDELDRLTDVFNNMMQRLDDSFSGIREFTLHASHELKTPLTIMRGEIEMRLRDPATPSHDRDFFVGQLDEINRLTKIVDALTFLAKADAGLLKLADDEVALDALVRDNFADTQILAASRGLQVELTACEPVSVRGDRHRLRQVLLNLTENALKYNCPEGRITMSLVRNNGHAELTIANTGPGVQPEQIERVFDRFYRGDPAHNSDGEGCGLGLSIAQGIVRAHRGAISLKSEPGELTSVEVKLPVV